MEKASKYPLIIFKIYGFIFLVISLGWIPLIIAWLIGLYYDNKLLKGRENRVNQINRLTLIND